MRLEERKIAIIGAAATGRAAAPVLARRGARVVVFDAKPAEALGSAASDLRQPRIELRLGDDRYPGIEDADLIVPSPGVPAHASVLRQARARGVTVLAEIDVAGAIARAPIIAVTGTNGKTTTIMMTAQALRAAGREVIVGGNALAGGYQVPLIAAADRAAADCWIVAEVSSFQLEQAQTFRPQVAVVTNITADHLNRHGTVDAYVAAKARILAAQEPDDWAVLNADNPASAGLADQVRGNVALFSRGPTPHAPADAYGWTAERDGARWLMVRYRGEECTVCRTGDLLVPGEQTIENALASALAARIAGADGAAVGRGLAAFRGVADRLEYVATVRGVDYVNNTMCTNVDAAVRSLEAYSRPVVLIAGGKDKGSDFAPLGRAIAARARCLIAIGDDGPLIAESARQAGFSDIAEAGSMDEAVHRASERAAPGDVVLLAPACASFDWYSSFEQRGAAFKEAVSRLQREA